MLLVEGVEHHQLVDAVDELRAEIGLHLGHHRQLDHLVVVAAHLLDHLAAQVGGHDDHGVLEVHRAALAVGHAAVVEHLQQHVENIRMGLLHLVEQDHAVGLAPHRFGQVAAFLVADIAGRRADEAGDGMLLHELAHVDADEVLLGIEEELRQRLAQLGLAHAGGAEEEEGAVGPVLVRQPGARTADGVRDEAHRLVLADDAAMQALFHLQQLLALALHHLADRDAGGARDHLGDLFGADLGAQEFLRRVLGADFLRGLELGLELRQLAVLQLGHLLQLALALQLRDLGADAVDLFLDVGRALHLRLLRLPHLVEVGVFLFQPPDLALDQVEALLRRLVLLLLHRLALDLQLDQAAVEPVHDFRLGVDFHLDARRRLVDQVDGLVRQEAVGDVAVRQFRRGDDGRVGDLDAVVQLVFLLQAAQDGDGGFDRRLVHQHLLEAALQRGILLHILAVFVQRGGADAVQFAARERRLEHVAGIHGAFRLAGADHGVQLVDEDDDAAFVLGDLLQHALQALLELAAVLGAGQQRRHVEGKHAFPLQRLRHFLVDDALGQALDDGRLAHARLADQHRVVLGAPLQDLDGAADLVVAANHRVELALAGALGQVQRVFLQRLALPLRFLRANALAAAHGLDGRLQRLLLQAVFLQQTAGLALVVRQGQQEHLRGDELVAALLRVLVRQVEQIGQVAADLHLAGVAFHLGQARHRLFRRALQRGDVDAGARQQRGAGAVVLPQQRQQQMLRFDELLVAAHGDALGIGQGLLELGGEFVEAHVYGSVKPLS